MTSLLYPLSYRCGTRSADIIPESIYGLKAVLDLCSYQYLCSIVIFCGQISRTGIIVIERVDNSAIQQATLGQCNLGLIRSKSHDKSQVQLYGHMKPDEYNEVGRQFGKDAIA